MVSLLMTGCISSDNTSHVDTHLTGKSNKSKATAPFGITIHHDNGINNFAEVFKEVEELFIIDCCCGQLGVHVCYCVY